MELEHVPTVLSVRQLASLLRKSKSWLYEQWGREGNDLPPRFKIGSNTRILGKDAVAYIARKINASSEMSQ